MVYNVVTKLKKEVIKMIEKVKILAEMKRAGMNVDNWIEKMYAKYGKEDFQFAIKVQGYSKLFEI